MVSKLYHSLPCVSVESMSVSDGGSGVGYSVGGGVGEAEGSVHHGGGVGLGEGLANYGLAGSDRGRGVSHSGGSTVSDAMGGTVGDTVTGAVRDGGGDGGVTSQLLGEHGRDTSGGTVQLSLSGLHSVDRLPRVVFSGVDGLSVELGGLVMVFTGGVSGGADMVGGFNMGVDGGTSEVSGRDGGEGGGGVGHCHRGGVGHSQGGG